ncbi:PQQ-dependent sugar dehydrogenase [Acinetobacter sp.]|uniref:PQQ-dependent sugar dehydrogenase n=1 Tax=Acinetobacter sp. TaxID=472 RepID=UPI002649F336|nr:PQQ-dependent sugar dehydrogenase [Acinetobacter sp.]MDN5512080.1 PQQ-dependent sugar dehydrogenase [Acinetobacter sp.]MDN5523499.1 PQQ-dependent sugar dehydrogenase [Acinetobacter sp.]
MKIFRQHMLTTIIFISTSSLTACNAQTDSSKNLESKQATETSSSTAVSSSVNQTYKLATMTQFNEPWAMIALKDGRLLVTERKGKLQLFDPQTKQKTEVKGMPKVAYGGQGGLGDIALHPQFAQNHIIYLSYAEAGQEGYGAVVARGELDLSNSQKPQVKNLTTIWQQVPKVQGQGHYAHRLLFGQDEKLWVSSGERQKFNPAQDMQSNLGKILRLNDDGIAAAGNPFSRQGEIAKQLWSLGHRNPLGIAFDAQGKLWVAEMGPKGGDELNLILKGENYGYPVVSNGNHYDGRDIPDHDTHPEFKAPEISWTPVISPSSLIFYNGSQFPAWKNKALIGGLSSKAIIVVDTAMKPVTEVQRVDMKQRIRDLLQAPDGSIWVLEDGNNARLLKMTAK